MFPRTCHAITCTLGTLLDWFGEETAPMIQVGHSKTRNVGGCWRARSTKEWQKHQLRWAPGIPGSVLQEQKNWLTVSEIISLALGIHTLNLTI